MLAKVLRLMALLPRHPKEAYERTQTIIASRREKRATRSSSYSVSSSAEALSKLSEFFHEDLDGRLNEPALLAIERIVRTAQTALPSTAPFRRSHNGDFLLARFCYLITRAIRPSMVIETGVCYGVTSSFILQALNANGQGYLHSIDLPPLGENADVFVGKFIPAELRKRWTLHRGSSASCLKPLLRDVGFPQVFVHDSLHTYANMRTEFGTVWPGLQHGNAVISDDIQSNNAFRELMSREDAACSVVLHEENKESLFGIVLRNGHTRTPAP